jgi:hypothetical protein
MEGARRRELAELMSNHILCDIDGKEATAIVNSNRFPDHLGEDRGTSRPCLDGSTIVGALVDDLLDEMVVYERAFLYGSRQGQISRYV